MIAIRHKHFVEYREVPFDRSPYGRKSPPAFTADVIREVLGDQAVQDWKRQIDQWRRT